jgi:REP element-mobilizing transposase RayT
MKKVNEPAYWHFFLRIQRDQPTLKLSEGLIQSFESEAARWEARILVLGGIENHLHLAVRLPHGCSHRRFVEGLKTASASHICWQKRHGAWELSKTQLPYAISYIICQKEHHTRGNLWPFWELADKK